MMSIKNTFSYVLLTTAILLVSSCSLVKIENEQRPLGIGALNTRLLTQNFARTAMDRVVLAADSIANLSKDNKKIQLNTLRWKIQTSEELGRVSFQTEPKVALMDTWAYFLEVRNSFEKLEGEGIFGAHNAIALDAISKNIDEIENIAVNVMPQSEYEKIKDFVQVHADKTPLLVEKDFKHQSIRESYLKFKNIPDSIAVQTVGTLSEVVADASNRIGYYSDASGKRFNWKTEMILKEKGLDSVAFEAKFAEFEKQFDRLIAVAENAPENMDGAIKEFRKNMGPLFNNLNYEIRLAMQSLSSDVMSIDTMLMRERVVLDSIVMRERIALTAKADTLVETGIEKAFEGLGNMLQKLIIYFILLFIVVLGLPFYLGYLTGKRKNKST